MASTPDQSPDPSPPVWRNRIVGHADVSPADLVANPRNWRLHGKGQQDAVGGVLAEVGWVQSVVVNQRTGFVVDGHLRVRLAAEREEASIPVVYVDLDEREEGVILASLDTTAAMATRDDALLAFLLAAAGRHTVFRFDRIANYYAHARTGLSSSTNRTPRKPREV